MPYATFLLLNATPAWLALPDADRQRIVASELQPILTSHKNSVRATYYDTEAYSARPSDLLMLEYDQPHAHAEFIDALRSSSMFNVPYFTLDDLLVGKQAAWLEAID